MLHCMNHWRRCTENIQKCPKNIVSNETGTETEGKEEGNQAGSASL